jgi:SAM-dependent methyltransferase
MDWHNRFLQQAGWTRDLRLHVFKLAGLRQARQVLEVGCGTGAILTDFSRRRQVDHAFTTAVIYGLDLDLSHLAEAHENVPAAVLTCGDALDLPYGCKVFDITFCHFLLLWVSDPLQALSEMERVTRRGGAVLALAEPDYESRLDEPDDLVPLGSWQTMSLRQQGADPGLGKRLAYLFQQAGIEPIETGTLRAKEQLLPTPAERELEWAVLEADLAGLVGDQELQRMKALDLQAWEHGTRRLNVPTYFAWGKV